MAVPSQGKPVKETMSKQQKPSANAKKYVSLVGRTANQSRYISVLHYSTLRSLTGNEDGINPGRLQMHFTLCRLMLIDADNY